MISTTSVLTVLMIDGKHTHWFFSLSLQTLCNTVQVNGNLSGSLPMGHSSYQNFVAVTWVSNYFHGALPDNIYKALQTVKARLLPVNALNCTLYSFLRPLKLPFGTHDHLYTWEYSMAFQAGSLAAQLWFIFSMAPCRLYADSIGYF